MSSQLSLPCTWNQKRRIMKKLKTKTEMLRRNGPVAKSVESVLRLKGSLWWEKFVKEVGTLPVNSLTSITSSSWRYHGKVRRSTSHVKVYAHKRKTGRCASNEGFLVVNWNSFANMFIARRYASAEYTMTTRPSVRPLVCLSDPVYTMQPVVQPVVQPVWQQVVSCKRGITSRCSIKTVKHVITQTTPHDGRGTLVSWCQRAL